MFHLRPLTSWLLLGLVVMNGCVSAPTALPKKNEGLPSIKPQVKRVISVDTKAQYCLALAMYWEARGEGQRGMLAVGSVVLNRVSDDRFPDTACGVVYQGGEKPPCQFSWWCDGKSDYPKNRTLWASALSNASGLIAKHVKDETGGALFFHSNSIRQPWRREQTTRIGNHLFYR